jgi:hypothetical protein
VARLFFHLVTEDGREARFDRSGRDVHADADLAALARRLAADSLTRVRGVKAPWLVAIYNDTGDELALIPVTPEPRPRPARTEVSAIGALV